MDIVGTIILTILIGAVVFLVLLWVYKILKSFLDGIEMTYTYFSKRPMVVYFHPLKKILNKDQETILKQQFTFYNRLDQKQKKYFRHRVASFIKAKKFVGKDGFLITDEVQVLISATAVMLTFGFRDYIIKSIEHIVIYPTQYYSSLSKADHKGEFNVKLKTLVMSWDNFLEGYEIKDDKLNLGIHELAHAIHFNSMFQHDINSILFVDTYNEIRDLLTSNKNFKDKLVASEYLRSYAFTNDVELLAVILETFIETPKEFKSQFPEIYTKVKQMLNFNFEGY